MELFDAIDDHDQVVGTTDKVAAHAKRQLHRAVAVYVFDEKKRLYVQLHKKSGRYDHSVGGHVSKGETYEQAARREAAEELGIRQHLSQLAIFLSDEGDRLHMFGLFSCVANEEWRFAPNDEVDEITPMALEDIRRLMASQPERFTGGFIKTMNKYAQIQSKSQLQ